MGLCSSLMCPEFKHFVYSLFMWKSFRGLWKWANCSALDKCWLHAALKRACKWAAREMDEEKWEVQDNFCCPQVSQVMWTERMDTVWRQLFVVSRVSEMKEWLVSVAPNPSPAEKTTLTVLCVWDDLRYIIDVCRAIWIIKWPKGCYGIFCSTIKIMCTKNWMKKEREKQGGLDYVSHCDKPLHSINHDPLFSLHHTTSIYLSTPNTRVTIIS